MASEPAISSPRSIGDWQVDQSLSEISRDGIVVKLEPRAMQLLLCLAARAGKVVSVQELLDTVWSDVIVTPDSVYQAVSALRRTLGDNHKEPEYIATLPRRGYRLVAAVGQSAAAEPDASTGPVVEVAPVRPVGPEMNPPVEIPALPGPRSPVRRYRMWLLIVLLLVAVYLLIDIYLHSSRITRAPLTAPPPKPVAEPFAPPARSIAVLPFSDLSEKHDQEYFADGIAEELLNALARIDELQVAARTSSFSFRNQSVDVATIAHKLNVGAVLEGSVRRDGTTIRVTVQLINGINGFHLWSQTYDRSMTGILSVQSDIATAVAQQLKVELGSDAPEKLDLGSTKNPQAFDDQLRGQQLLAMATKEEDYRAAVAAFDRAIASDPRYAAAYVGRGFALSNIVLSTVNADTREKLGRQAVESARRAVSLAPDFGEAHSILAVTLQKVVLDYTGAAHEFDLALSLTPGSARVQRNFAFFAAEMGHFAPALAAARRAVSLDPQNAWSHVMLSHVFYFAHRFAEAQASLQDAETINPGNQEIGDWRSAALLGAGQNLQAQQECGSPATVIDDGGRYMCLAIAYHALGRQPDAERYLKLFQAQYGDSAAFWYSGVYAQWGDTKESLRWLATAVQRRDPALQLLKEDWRFDPVRGEPQFQAIVTRLNYPP